MTPERGTRWRGMRASLLAWAAFACSTINAFYLPGVAPMEYPEGGQVELKVNKLTSVKTQLPYAYYVLPYCQPPSVIDSVENLGEILTGDAIENSAYDIHMMMNTSCKVLCKKKLTTQEKEKFRTMIDEEYQVNWIIDNLPAATRYTRRGAQGGDYTYMNGFPVGIPRNWRYYIHNHVRLILMYHASPGEYEGYRIVGFEVEPHSMTQATREDGTGSLIAMCQDDAIYPVFDIDMHEEIVFTYDVMWYWS